MSAIPAASQGGTLIVRREALRQRAVQSTFLVPGLTIAIADERDPSDRVMESFQHKGGIGE